MCPAIVNNGSVISAFMLGSVLFDRQLASRQSCIVSLVASLFLSERPLVFNSWDMTATPVPIGSRA